MPQVSQLLYLAFFFPIVIGIFQSVLEVFSLLKIYVFAVPKATLTKVIIIDLGKIYLSWNAWSAIWSMASDTRSNRVAATISHNLQLNERGGTQEILQSY
jgi:hypothetical protein